jgi:hypothetical protein
MTTQGDPSKNWPVVDENGDFIWRFHLDSNRAPALIPDHAFAELFRSQLDEVLKLIILTWKGQRVRVDGFRFIDDPDHTYPIWSSSENVSPDRNHASTSSKDTCAGGPAETM